MNLEQAIKILHNVCVCECGAETASADEYWEAIIRVNKEFKDLQNDKLADIEKIEKIEYKLKFLEKERINLIVESETLKLKYEALFNENQEFKKYISHLQDNVIKNDTEIIILKNKLSDKEKINLELLNKNNDLIVENNNLNCRIFAILRDRKEDNNNG